MKKVITDSAAKQHYVKNADLLEAVIEAKKLGRLTDRLGAMLLKIAERYSYHPWFKGYSFREDLVGAAVTNLVVNWHKFDETRYSNPFAYYTTSCYRSFLGYMHDEKIERNIKDELLMDLGEAPSWSYSGKLSDEHAFRSAAEE